MCSLFSLFFSLLFFVEKKRFFSRTTPYDSAYSSQNRDALTVALALRFTTRLRERLSFSLSLSRAKSKECVGITFVSSLVCVGCPKDTRNILGGWCVGDAYSALKVILLSLHRE